ncbi:hypothetical protein [Nocardia anaemiae]|uniref:hypothetical protein n=1 Tax=Nocardia anaemiae TaxID=263910 RepID=UPI0012F47CC0|nr:hypothetical protein [Nocardia anaemiae]
MRRNHSDQLQCLLEITWPAGGHRWWSLARTGPPEQIAAALEELATRIRIDHITRILGCIDRPVGYTLELRWPDGTTTIVTDAQRADEIPAVLRAHTLLIRGRSDLIDPDRT